MRKLFVTIEWVEHNRLNGSYNKPIKYKRFVAQQTLNRLLHAFKRRIGGPEGSPCSQIFSKETTAWSCLLVLFNLNNCLELSTAELDLYS